MNIAEACLNPPGTSPEKIALRFIGQDQIRSVSFRDLKNAAGTFAASLQSLPPSSVLIIMKNAPAFATAFFGTMQAGLLAVPLPYSWTKAEVEAVRLRIGAKVIVTDRPELHSQFQAVFYPDENRLHLISSNVKHSPSALRSFAPGGENPAYMIFTSGTTARPKAVVHAHRALQGRYGAIRYWANIAPEDEILHTGALNWTYTLGLGLTDPLSQGATALLFEKAPSGDELTEALQRFQPSLLVSVPAYYRRLARHSQKLFSPPKGALSAGESLPASLWNDLSEGGLTIREGLGMSECSYYLSNLIGENPVPGSVGRPQPGHKIALLNEENQPTAPEETGMIHIRGDDPGLFLRYFDEERQLLEIDGRLWFRTGDKARKNENGIWFFEGRDDDILTCMGYRISPLEVEQKIGEMRSIEQIAVSSVALDGKTLLAAFFVPKAGHFVSDENIRLFLRDKLAAYKIPHLYFERKSLPRSANGKLIRSHLSPD